MSKSVLFYILVSASVILGTVRLSAQDIALKTNGLYWLTTTVNAGVEIAVSNKLTIDFQAAYNPWTFQDDKKCAFGWRNRN